MKRLIPALQDYCRGPVYGINLLILAVGLIMVMNLFMKMAEGHHPIEQTFYRNLFALILICAVIVARYSWSILRTQRPWSHVSRAIAGNIGLTLVFASYQLMPMAEVTALMFTGGLMTTMVAPFALGERVGIYRWGAVLVGFGGAVIIAQPGTENFNALGVATAMSAAFFGGALVSVFLRSLGKTERAMTTVFYFLSIGVVLSAPYVAFYGSLPDMETLPLLIGAGIAGGISLIMKTEAYRHAEASLLSPVHYTALIWAVLFDIFIWDIFPNALTLGGAAVIILANMVILWRESQRSVSDKDRLRQEDPDPAL